jgi:hypothetical protein
MSILLWYLPYAMFSNACDVVLAERGRRMSSIPRNEGETPMKQSWAVPPDQGTAIRACAPAPAPVMGFYANDSK